MQKQRVIENLQEKIKGIERQIAIFEKYVPEELPDKVSLWGTENAIRITMPFSWSLYRELRRALDHHLLGLGLEEGWRVGERWQDINGDLYVRFRTDEAYMIICLDPTLVGATCELVPESVKEVQVYKVVCHD